MLCLWRYLGNLPICIVFSYSGSQGYSFITTSGDQAGCDLRDRLARAGYADRLYYFETLGVREGQLQGYWSRSMEPGQPIWPSTADERGTSWGWEHVNFIPGLTVEVSRYETLISQMFHVVCELKFKDTQERPKGTHSLSALR